MEIEGSETFPIGRRLGGRGASRRARLATTAFLLAAAACAPRSRPALAGPSDAVIQAPDSNLYLVKGRPYGTDVYGGPLDVIANKGLTIAQWRNRTRHVFTHQFAWKAVWKSVSDPGPAMRQGGGWLEVMKRHVLPFGGDELRDGQWVPNYFGHVLEGGLAFRRQAEWNRTHGVPFPTLAAFLATQTGVVINEAFETPTDQPFVNEHGTAGAFMDIMVFDPVGMFLFSHDGVTRFMAERFGAQLWPTQASIALPQGMIINNSESVILRPRLWFTDRARLFIRSGLGVEAGLSIPRADGTSVSFGAGVESTRRILDEEGIERANFAASGGVWIDRDGSLLMSLTVDQLTDRRVAVNVYPGVLRIGQFRPGAWAVLDSENRFFFGLAMQRNIGVGLGLGIQ